MDILKSKLKLSKEILGFENPSYYQLNYSPKIFMDTEFSAEELREQWSSFLADTPKPVIDFYLHIPFCVKLCSFCQYPKEKYRAAEEVSRYLVYVKEYISYFREAFRSVTFRNLYIGGRFS